MFSEMRPRPSFEDDFNRWYDTEHIPLRMRIKGFESAQRYHNPAEGNYLAIYELGSLDVFTTPAFQQVKMQASETTTWMLANVKGFTRYLGDEIASDGTRYRDSINAPVLHAVLLEVPQALLDRFDDWCAQEHVPKLLRDDECLMVRRFEIVSGEPRPYNRLALHYRATANAHGSQMREMSGAFGLGNGAAPPQWLEHASEMTFTKHEARQIAQH